MSGAKVKTLHRIINGDSRNMDYLPDKSVHLAVTSPPYWQLKDYGTVNQIGFDDSYEDYISNLNKVWGECFRVLYPGCRLCINIGDQFASSADYGRYKVIPIRTEIIKFCESCGFDYMGAVIWQKITTTNTAGGATIMGSFPYPRNGILKLDYEFILIFKKPGIPPKPEGWQKEKSILTKEEWNMFFSGHWNFKGSKQKRHGAVFPPELPRRLIKMFSFTGETVLDPFLGSGTTSLAAATEYRNSIGIEINPEYIKLFSERLKKEAENISDAEFDLTETRCESVYAAGGKNPELLSRLSAEKSFSRKSEKAVRGNQEKDYYSVREVLSGSVLKLNNDLIIQLIGLKDIRESEAMEYLRKELKGNKVYLRYDAVRQDEHNRLLCYLYLKNNTFINAHLIKKGFCKADREADYRLKTRFVKYEETAEAGFKYNSK